MRFHRLKKLIEKQLRRDSFTEALDTICAYPPRQAVNPLFSFFLHPEELIRWRSVSAMGRVVCVMVEQEGWEAARIVMRRMIWSLNDESGGIGWGAPEAIGECMVLNPGLAREYHNILVSYILPHGNYLEHPVLQRGVLWGVARLAAACPHYVEPVAEHLTPFLSSDDPFHRGLASRAASHLQTFSLNTLLEERRRDPAPFTLYQEGELYPVTVAQAATPGFSPGVARP